MMNFESELLLNTLTNVGTSVLALAIAALLSRFSGRLARLLTPISLSTASPALAISPADDNTQAEINRRQTLNQLLANTLSAVFFTVAVVISLAQFSDFDTLLWVFGFFSTAIAFASATYVGDLLSGFNIILQDKYVVGEKIQTKSQVELIEGVVERVNLNITQLRARTGELYLISNGDMRFVRNYSRGPHSATTLVVKLPTEHIIQAITLLKEIGHTACTLFPEVKEPWLVISETGAVASSTELLIAIKTEFGHAAIVRPKLMIFIQEQLTLAGIELAE